MIATITKGTSFSGCICYCLKDKKELSEEQKQQLSQKDGLQHKDRAEILYYNKCFGDEKELAEDFREVARLSKRIEKSVLHVSLRLAPGEQLSRDKWMEVGQECARELGIADNQYICVLHKDTKGQHIHIVANRVGFNGKAVSDSNDYRKMDSLCRKLEKQYKLQEVLSPRSFLSSKERLFPRQDSRKIRLENAIRRTLFQVNHYHEFEGKMKQLGYRVIKGRGIAFIDDKKVKIKGSEVGYSLAKIERILSLKQKLTVNVKEQEKYEQAIERNFAGQRVYTAAQRLLQQTRETALMERSPFIPIIKEAASLLDELLKPEQSFDSMPYELTAEGYRRRKRKEQAQSQSPHR